MPVDKIPYIDHPDLKINKNESTQMPFRYVKDENGEPIMPKVSRLSDLMRQNAMLTGCIGNA